VTPFLASLAKESVSFLHAVVAGAPTYFSLPAIMASRYPLSLGREVVGIAPGESTIASILQGSGYQTAAFIAANPYLSPRFGYSQGFQQFSDFLGQEGSTLSEPATISEGKRPSRLNQSLGRLSRKTKFTAAAYDELYFRYCQWRSARQECSMDQLRRYPAADVLVDRASTWVRELGDQPFFLWLHLMDPHHPYYPPEEGLRLMSCSHITPKRARFLNSFWNRGDLSAGRLQRHREEVTALYDAGVRWVDYQLSRLVSVLKETRRWSDTIFAVTADHGEEFLEHETRYHSPTSLSEQLLRVPLLLHAPEPLGPKVVAAPFSLIHLAPTLLDGQGVEAPRSFAGRTHWKEIGKGEMSGSPVISECIDGCNNPLRRTNRIQPRLLAVRDGDYKLVLRFRDGTDALYDMRADPEERNPLTDGVASEKRVQLLRIAWEHLRHSREGRDQRLALRARLREARQRIELKVGNAEKSQVESAVVAGEHG